MLVTRLHDRFNQTLEAERNVLPTLNNLLENREMQLDDGRLLIPARRYDVLTQEEISVEEGKAKLVRVHADFRVVALAVPSPPWPGNPLDPPLRSRFQARIIMPPNLVSAVQLQPFFHLPSNVAELETLLRRLTALHRALEQGQMPGGLRTPTLTYDAIARLLRLVLHPSEIRPTPGEALHRVYPVGLLVANGKTAVRDATEQLLRHFDLAEDSKCRGRPQSVCGFQHFVHPNPKEPRAMSVSPISSSSTTGMVQLQLSEGRNAGKLCVGEYEFEMTLRQLREILLIWPRFKEFVIVLQF
eukprot:symbB.v1.2.000134.t1/scaffold16.1/size461936/8